jgi:hypothetical protein
MKSKGCGSLHESQTLEGGLKKISERYIGLPLTGFLWAMRPNKAL